jgi:uncharacterized protein
MVAAGMTTGDAAERIIQAPGPSGPLQGVLNGVPAPGAPVILIIPGSGPTDRDGNSPLGIRAGTYRLLADGLAAAGIASVRIDKRGLHGSAAAVADANAATIADYAADVASWVRAIRAETAAGCVVLLGHSEGGLVALEAASGADVCGLVLAATPGRPLGAILREQLRANPANAPLLPDAEAAISALENGRRVDVSGLPVPLRALFRPEVQPFLIDLMARDPVRLAATIRLPMLILQGDRDLQVGVEDARRLRTAAADAELTLLPDVNHVLKRAPAGGRAENLATYADPALPLADGVVDAVTGFMRRMIPKP